MATNKLPSRRAFIGLGGNMGDPQQSMAVALKWLDESLSVTVRKVSSLYRTPPWGKTDQPDFLNAVAELTTKLEPLDLLNICLDIEHRLHRVREERWGPRPIDLDILWFDGRTIDVAGLHVPHPRLLERAFVVVPLAEIAPDLHVGETPITEAVNRLDTDGITIASSDPSWWLHTG